MELDQNYYVGNTLCHSVRGIEMLYGDTSLKIMPFHVGWEKYKITVWYLSIYLL